MSVRTMTRVWEGSKHAGTPLLMLLAIADFADDDGRAYPAVATLAAKCRTSSRNAIRILAELADSGELQVLKNKGPRGTNVYRIDLQALTSVSPLTSMSPLTAKVAGGDIGVRGGGDIQPQKPLTRVSPEPSVNRQVNHQEPSGGSARKRTPTLPPVDLLPGVPPDLVADWLSVRKAKKSGAITKTVVAGLKREADKLGISLEQALRLCAERGWTSLRAEWDSAKSAAAQLQGRSGRQSFNDTNYLEGLNG